jgi:hypothetical protein
VEPQVKVESAVVDMATGKAPTPAVGVAEARVLQALASFFALLLVEGLLLAGSVRCAVGSVLSVPACARAR